MSLNSLAASRVARELSTRGEARYFAASSEDAVGPKEADVQNALSALVEYVPAETITLYLAMIASLPVIDRGFPWITGWFVYCCFAALTPLLFSLIYAGKSRAAGDPRLPGLRNWPWWPMIAATIAFLAWGLAVPEGPALSEDKPSSQALASLLAIFVSILLGVVGRFFGSNTAASIPLQPPNIRSGKDGAL